MTLHLDRGRHEPLCGHYFAGDYCTVKAERVTCKRCLARMAARNRKETLTNVNNADRAASRCLSATGANVGNTQGEREK